MRLELDPLPLRPLLLRPFDDERDFAVVRLRPLLELRPFDELLLRLDERLLPLEELLLPLEELLLRLEELLRRELAEERRRLTSPSSISPRHDPVSSSSISM